ncbi:carbohydrate ABC transporter permease [Marispirochaeta sp.]|jgi:glucose/mannose transport system permease protein|uniref:carbohydrate ABC transporter permease n=1 Tax=Marispirochaeta sp. TaxID=2038653 RepID=UPI0029C7BD08|nr:carbohydrate ABC transporter permease [Marispirochaeta sp.]
MSQRTLRKVSPMIYVLLLIVLVIFLVPIYMAMITALKNPAEISLSTAWIPPSRPYWKSFADALDLLLPSLKNSVVLTVSGTIISALVGSINGFVFSKNRFRGSEVLFTFFLFGMFIPYQIILIPLFQVLRSIGIYGSLSGLILAHVVYGIPITTLIFRNFYDQIPDSLVESARLDGAGFFFLYGRLFLPLSVPGFVVVGIWQFTQIWNEFLWGVTLTNQDSQPVTVGLAQLAGGQAVSWNLPMAGSFLAALPVLLIFILLGQYFIRGLLAGSVKE